MAHNITVKNGKAEMAYVGATPWTNLGQTVTQGASLETWAIEAGLNWEAKATSPYYRYYLPDGSTAVKAYEGNKILYRSDDGSQLSIVGEDYKIVQPLEILEFFREACESNGWYIHTAGTLRGGRKLWVMASRGEDAQVADGDVIQHNLLAATSLDGSLRTVFKDTPVRIVCNNTLTSALRGSGKEIGVSHKSIVDFANIKVQLGFADSAFTRFMVSARELSNQVISPNEATDILMQLLKAPKSIKELEPVAVSGQLPMQTLDQLLRQDKPMPAQETVYDKTPRAVARIMSLFNGDGMGAHLDGSMGTKWGLLNAVTQYVDHDMGRNDNNRMESAWFGRGETMKNEAWELLTN